MEEIESENYTLPDYENVTSSVYENDTLLQEPFEDTLSNHQIVSLAWCILCLLPNILLLYIFIKNHLYHINFYLILMNWCMSDFIYISTMLYVLVVPEKYVNFSVMEVFYFVNSVIPTLAAFLIILFMFDIFLKSEKFCKYFIFAYWIALILYTIAIIVLCQTNYYFLVQFLYVLGFFKILSVLLLIVKIVMFLFRQRDDESAGLRIIMAGLYIILNFYVWFFELLLVLKIVTENFFEFLLYASYADAFINLSLLLYFSSTFKCYFCQLFQKQDKTMIIDYPENL